MSLSSIVQDQLNRIKICNVNVTTFTELEVYVLSFQRKNFCTKDASPVTFQTTATISSGCKFNCDPLDPNELYGCITFLVTEDCTGGGDVALNIGEYCLTITRFADSTLIRVLDSIFVYASITP